MLNLILSTCFLSNWLMFLQSFWQYLNLQFFHISSKYCFPRVSFFFLTRLLSIQADFGNAMLW